MLSLSVVFNRLFALLPKSISSMASAPGKRYGLILSQKEVKKPKQTIASVFGEDSDSDDAGLNDKSKVKTSSRLASNRAKADIQKALAEDASIFQYDEIYDDINKKEVETSK